MIAKKNIIKTFYIFLIIHLIIWTLIPSLTNLNLPLDTIEALAWGSNLDWGYSKHPPLSAFAVELFYFTFGSYDWVYYFLSQLYVLIAFFFVWKLSDEIFNNKLFNLISVLILEGIIFYNFTTPEFNVNISQLPFWSLTVYFFWRGLNNNNIFNWILFGIFSALGFLSKYLFLYILVSLFLFLLFTFKKNVKIFKNYIISIITSLIILIPHFIWLFENNFVTIFYGIKRSNISSNLFLDHVLNPSTLLLKQLFILIPFFLMIFVLLKKFKLDFRLKDKNTLFLLSITILPILLIMITSLFTGAKIRTMWLTPFYLFFGVFFLHIFKKQIYLKYIKKFYIIFLFFFLLSPAVYIGVSVIDDTKRTDYPGKEISRLVQNKWDDNFINDIKIVVGDEWFAGNLSYHLTSRPKWINDLRSMASGIDSEQGVIYTGNPKILKKVCPGIYGTIKPVGYCMIGRR